MFEDRQLDELMAQQSHDVEETTEIVETISENTLPAISEESTQIIEPSTYEGLNSTLAKTKGKIVKGAQEILNQNGMVKHHSEALADIADKGLKAEEEIERLKVEELNANNKVKKQEIKNRLIVLRAESKRLKKEQKQINKDQKAEHKKRNKDAQWELYGEKLKKMKYTYVPNIFVLKMLLFFDGVVSFFNGVDATSTSILKAFKWLLLIGVAITIIMVIPVSREWFLSLLQFK